MKKDKLVKFAIVNIITFIRVISSFIIPILYFKNGIGIFAMFVFLIFLTDFIDGKLSRFWKVESFFGSLLDSLSDKLFALVMIAILSYEYPVILLVLIMELLITITSILAFNDNKNVQSSKTGKVKAWVLDISISIIYLYLAHPIYTSYLSSGFNTFIIESESVVVYILIGIIMGMEILTLADYNKKRFKEDTKYEKIKGKKHLPFKEILFRFTDREFYIQNKDKKLKELLYN